MLPALPTPLPVAVRTSRARAARRRPYRPRSRAATAGGRAPGVPSLGLLLTEVPRAGLGLAALAASSPLLAVGPRGDGHPVLVLPGLLGADASTLVLRRYLAWLGYAVSGWRLGTNVGPTEKVVGGLRSRLDRLAASSGRRVSLVGWSLGGLYAHELARRSPGSVRQVVTLGSPVGNPRRGRSASQLFDRVAGIGPVPPLLTRPWSEAGSLRVPVTSVYTRGDGVVAWQACRVPPGRRRENVAVHASHLGLAHDPAVLRVVADRLALDEGAWRPFSPGLLRAFYP